MAKENVHVCPTCRTVLPIDPYRSSIINNAVQKRKIFPKFVGNFRSLKFPKRLRSIANFAATCCFNAMIGVLFVGALYCIVRAVYMFGFFVSELPHFGWTKILCCENGKRDPFDTWMFGFFTLLTLTVLPFIGAYIKSFFKKSK